RETRTNTPIQALTLLNDLTFVEAARALAQRVLREATSPEERLTLAFRRVLSRTPTEAELAVLHRALERHLTKYRNDLPAAKKLLRVGESVADSTIDPVDFAAFTEIS